MKSFKILTAALVFCLLLPFCLSACGNIVPSDITTTTAGTPCNHVEEVIRGKDPTCTENGLTEGKRCSLCGVILVEQRILYAFGHREYTAWTTVNAGGCSGSSFEARFCRICNYCDINSDSLNFVNPHDFKLLTKEPTLTKAGYEYRYECEICHTVGAEKIIPSSVYEQSSWKGKKWCAIGDSITIRYGNYVDTVAKALGLEATNLGIDGADANRMRLSISGEDENHPDYSPSRKRAVMEADLITVYGFANDYYPGAPALGDVYNSVRGTYAYNVKALIETILKLNPRAKIVIIGCHNIWDYYRPDIYEPVTGENRIADYIDMLDEIANYYGLPFIDMYHDSGINRYSASHLLADGCHPTYEGYERISQIIIRRLMAL